jgi:outer membrane protein assembly factor BamB
LLTTHSVAFFLLFACGLQAPTRENWPEFRGPTGQGIYGGSDLPLEWSTTANIRWKQSIPGKGWSSSIVVDGRVYLTTAVPGENDNNVSQSLRALCLDAASGKVLWDKEIVQQDGSTAPGIHAKNSHASPTPLTDGERLYVHFGHQGIACLNLAGAILWKNLDLGYKPVHGNGGSPVLCSGKLIFSCDGSDQQFVVALNSQTGKVIWKTPRESSSQQKFSFNTPLVIDVGAAKQVVSAGSGVINAYDVETGREIWRVRHGGYSVVPRAVYGHGLVFLCTGYNTPELLAIRADGQGDVTDTHVAWKTRRGAPNNPSPLLVGNELYLLSDAGTASCLDAKTGKVRWQERVGGAYSASPLFGARRLYLVAEDGQTTVLHAGAEFKVLARNRLEERTLASPAAADGALFIRTEKHLFRIQTTETTNNAH